jgi:hypothetical protein
MDKLERDRFGIDSALTRLLPDDVLDHIRGAQREQVVAVKTLIDHWLQRRAPARKTRERIVPTAKKASTKTTKKP